MRCLRAKLARCKKYVIPVELSGGRLHGVFNTDFRAFLRLMRAARRFAQSFLAGFLGGFHRGFEGCVGVFLTLRVRLSAPT